MALQKKKKKKSEFGQKKRKNLAPEHIAEVSKKRKGTRRIRVQS